MRMAKATLILDIEFFASLSLQVLQLTGPSIQKLTHVRCHVNITFTSTKIIILAIWVQPPLKQFRVCPIFHFIPLKSKYTGVCSLLVLFLDYEQSIILITCH